MQRQGVSVVRHPGAVKSGCETKGCNGCEIKRQVSDETGAGTEGKRADLWCFEMKRYNPTPTILLTMSYSTRSTTQEKGYIVG